MVSESNASPERFFTRVTKESRERRSTIKCETLDAILRIQELGGAVKDFDFEMLDAAGQLDVAAYDNDG